MNLKSIRPNPRLAEPSLVASTLRLRASDTVADQLMIPTIASLRDQEGPGPIVRATSPNRTQSQRFQIHETQVCVEDQASNGI